MNKETMQSTMCAEAPKKSESGIMTAIETNKRLVSSVNDEIDRLHQKVSPVMFEEPSTGMNEDPSSLKTEVEEKIAQSNDGLTIALDHLRHIINSIDL